MSPPREKARAFADAARKLCDALEQPPHDRQGAAALVLRCLTEVYALALALDGPGGQLGEDELDERHPVSLDLRNTVVANVDAVFGERRYYWLQFDPVFPRNEGEAPVLGDLADDLADIHGDLLPALEAWEAGSDRLDDFLFEWRGTPFTSHWGVHAAQALHALHLIVFDHGVGAR